MKFITYLLTNFQIYNMCYQCIISTSFGENRHFTYMFQIQNISVNESKKCWKR